MNDDEGEYRNRGDWPEAHTSYMYDMVHDWFGTEEGPSVNAGFMPVPTSILLHLKNARKYARKYA